MIHLDPTIRIHRRAVLSLALIVFTAGLLAAPGLNQEPPLPSAESLVEKAVERTRQIRSQESPQRYIYHKISISEELDDKNKVQTRQEKEYEVTQWGASTRQRMIKLNGKPIDEAEAKSFESRERRQRRETAGAPNEKPPEKTRDRGGWLTEDLIRKFQYKVEKRERVGTRNCIVLAFEPRSKDQPASQVADRVYNRLAGTIWFDEEESEICRLEVRLTEKVTLWGGLLGALQTFELNLLRERSIEGPWFAKSFKLSLEGRRLMDSMRMRIGEESSGFRRAE